MFWIRSFTLLVVGVWSLTGMLNTAQAEDKKAPAARKAPAKADSKGKADKPADARKAPAAPAKADAAKTDKAPTAAKAPARRPAPTANKGAAPQPPTGLKAADVPSDNGDALQLTWKPSKDDGKGKSVRGYNVYAATSKNGPWYFAGKADAGSKGYTFKGFKIPGKKKKAKKGKKAKKAKGKYIKAQPGTNFYFKVAAFTKSKAEGSTGVVGPQSPVVQWFNRKKGFIFFLGFLICFFIIFFIQSAKRGRQLFIRKLAGLEAIDEAVGRATEMGRPVLFVPGIMDMDNVQTLAGLTILGHVSKTVAEYDTEIDVPVSKSLVMTTGREVVYQGYLEAGRPDAYSDDIVHYITDAQFGYVAGVNGTIVRDKPATCFYLGAFYAESLILAETGNSTGSIQIAGTAMPSQLPFFVAACDYTLIGEELFAASAYLSNDPKQMGSLKGQDVGKAIVMGCIIVGSLLATVATVTGSAAAKSALLWFKGLF